MTTHKIDPNQREDLRKVYLYVYDSALTTTIPEVAADLDLKRTYVKELIGVLETHADRNGDSFVIVNSEPGENGNDEPHTWYSTYYTVDEQDRDFMQHWFDEHFPANATPAETKAAAPRTPRNATNPADLPNCLCGCGGICNRGRNYKPGHDARHAGQIAREMAATDNLESRDRLKDQLPTDALRWKAASMADRLIKKGLPKEDRLAENPKPSDTVSIEKVEEVDGVVKVGRWVYEAKQNSKSGAVRYTKKANPDVWHVATDKQAASFAPRDTTPSFVK